MMGLAEFRSLVGLIAPERRHKARLAVLGVLSMMLALLEAAGIGSIGPLVALMQSPERFEATGFGGFLQYLSGGGGRDRLLMALAMLLVCLFLLKTFVALAHAFLVQRYSQRFYTSLSQRLLAGYLRMPYEAASRTNSAVLIRNVITETRLVVDHVVLQGLIVLSEGLVLLLILATLFYINAWAALALGTATLLIVAALGLLSQYFGSRYGRVREAAEADLVKLAQSAITGLRELRIAGTGEAALARFGDTSERYARAATMVGFVNVFPRVILEGLAMAAVLGTIVVVMLDNAPDQLPTVAVFVAAGYRLLPALNRIYASATMFYFVLPSLVKLAPTLAAPLEHSNRDRHTPRVPLPLLRELKADGLSFTYENSDQPVISGASLHVRPGEMIGLVGPSGAGKSTLVNMILGLLKPREGQVLWNDAPVRSETEIAALHASVAYVAQNVFIADDTLGANIALGVNATDIDAKRLQQALLTAELNNLVNDLPDGLDTQIGERGARLSGGQAQRLGIARAVYLDRPLLVLDEATSALDIATEAAVLRTLRTFAADKAILAISHREASLEGCDRIYQLQHGLLSRIR